VGVLVVRGSIGCKREMLIVRGKLIEGGIVDGGKEMVYGSLGDGRQAARCKKQLPPTKKPSGKAVLSHTLMD
jgi:hypothetical protein